MKPIPDIILPIEQSTVNALPFPSAIPYFTIYAQLNQSLKVKMITMPGWRQVVVQLSTNSWRHVHRL
jgi:hypothetical protein